MQQAASCALNWSATVLKASRRSGQTAAAGRQPSRAPVQGEGRGEGLSDGIRAKNFV